MFPARARQKSNGLLKISGPLLVGGIQATDVCIGLRKNEPELKAKLDKAIGDIRADGTLSAMSEKWFSLDLSPKH